MNNGGGGKKGHTMTDTGKWEYRVETFGSAMRSVRLEELQAAMNALGEEGWEVLAVHQPQNSNKFWVFAKRALTAAIQKRRVREARGW